MPTILSYRPDNFRDRASEDYYGFHRVRQGWVYREYAPQAKELYLAGEFNNWDWSSHPMMALGGGNWVLFLPGEEALWEGCKVKLRIDGVEMLPRKALRCGSGKNWFGRIENCLEPAIRTNAF